MPETGSPGGLKLYTCPDCGISFESDVPRCPECGRRVAVSKSRTTIIVIAIVLTLAVLVAFWAASITPISPDF